MPISVYPPPQPDAAIKSREGDIYADVSRYGQLITGVRHDDILVRFEYSNSTEDVELATSGTGSTGNANAMALINTGTGVGAASITSLRSTAYRPGHEIYDFHTTVYATPEVNTYQRHGLFDADNGYFFGYEGTAFGVTVRDAGSDNRIDQADWNGDKCDGTGRSGFDLNHQTNNQYKITYGWLGSAPATFWVYGGDEYGWILAHTYDKSNLLTVPVVEEPSQHVNFEIGRTVGTGADMQMKTSSWGAGTIAGQHTHAGHRVFAGEVSKTILGGVETHIGTFRNKSTFQGRTNKVRIEATYIGVATDGNKPVLFRFYRNSTLTGPVWADVDTANSVTDVDATATLTTPVDGKYELTIPVARAQSESIIVGDGHIHLELLPGETMTLTAFSSSGSDTAISFRWEEYFA